MFNNALIFFKKDFFEIRTLKEFLICCLAISFPVNQKISTILLVLTGIVSVFEFKKSDFLSFLKLTLPMILLYIIYVISYARDGLSFESYWFEKKASLLIFPIIFFNTDWPLKKRVLRLFVYGCIISYLICLFTALYNSFDGVEFNFIKEIPNKKLKFTEAVDYNANRVLGTAFIITGFQRSYFSIYFCFALLIVLNGFKEKKLAHRILIISILIVGIIQTWSLAGILSLFLVIAFTIFMNVKNLKSKLLFILIASIGFVGVINLNNRAKFMYQTIVSGDLKIDGPTASAVRLRPWIASINEIEKNPIWGYGIKNSQKALNSYYRSKLEKYPGFRWPLERKFNAHNQYFQFILEIGVIGLLLFVLVVISFVNKVKNSSTDQKLIGYGFLSLILFNFLFESMMNRYMGISFIALFLSLFLTISRTPQNCIVREMKKMI
ncbi:O-antigen ligase family protein [uncultured Aquimarina sp.]|uniref:O-antigen ligase family protein n=1 Tax=uncultured Aquimarina sp. TaxID=575652 RepID=UPI00262214B2|nr:O-antigen ligase family protein [uncultured Aquimarina sp.]